MAGLCSVACGGTASHVPCGFSNLLPCTLDCGIRVQNYDSLIGANPAAVTRDSPAEEARLDDLEGHVQHGWTRAHIKVPGVSS